MVGGWVGREGGNEPLWNGFIGHISLRHSSSFSTVAVLLLGMVTCIGDDKARKYDDECSSVDLDFIIAVILIIINGKICC